MRQRIEEQTYRQIVMELLDQFVEFCEMHGLRYYLAYGTCLGAVRHRDMIPWDDDIDVSMPREDYNRFLRLAKEQNVAFRVFCENSPEGYPLYYAKISSPGTVIESTYMRDIEGLGTFVDIFPMDEVFLKPGSAKKLTRKMEFLTQMMALSAMKKHWPSGNPIKNTVKKVIFRCSNMVGNRYWRDQIAATISSAVSKKETDAPSYLLWSTVLPASVFGAGTIVKFGERAYVCPADTDRYLTCMYGDYMTLPPAEHRVSVHDFEAWHG